MDPFQVAPIEELMFGKKICQAGLSSLCLEKARRGLPLTDQEHKGEEESPCWVEQPSVGH